MGFSFFGASDARVVHCGSTICKKIVSLLLPLSLLFVYHLISFLISFSILPFWYQYLSFSILFPWLFFFALLSRLATLRFFSYFPLNIYLFIYYFARSGDNTVKVWDLNVGTCVRTIHGHKKFVSALQVICNSKFEIRNSQFAIRNSQFAIRNSQLAIRNS